ncbi:unnamed protein product [Leuciscus chuanchicus]
MVRSQQEARRPGSDNDDFSEDEEEEEDSEDEETIPAKNVQQEDAPAEMNDLSINPDIFCPPLSPDLLTCILCTATNLSIKLAIQPIFYAPLSPVTEDQTT